MTALHLLALSAYFIVLFEFIAMRHRVICADSDVSILLDLWANHSNRYFAMILYWNRGTK